MKKLLLTLSLAFLTIISYSQIPQFTLSEEKQTFPNQFVTIDTDGLTIENSYKRIIDWINITYDDPSQVIKAQLEDKYIRIQSMSKDLYSPFLLRYLIEFRFEEKNVIIDVVELEIGVHSTQSATIMWSDVSFKNKKMYKKNGKPKKAYAKKARKNMNYFNKLVLSIDTHIKEVK